MFSIISLKNRRLKPKSNPFSSYKLYFKVTVTDMSALQRCLESGLRFHNNLKSTSSLNHFGFREIQEKKTNAAKHPTPTHRVFPLRFLLEAGNNLGINPHQDPPRCEVYPSTFTQNIVHTSVSPQSSPQDLWYLF